MHTKALARSKLDEDFPYKSCYYIRKTAADLKQLHLWFHRFGVSGFPTLKFFPKENKAGQDYDGGRDVDDFVNFINEKAGTSRDSKGQLTSKAGVVESLDALVKELVAAGEEEKKAILSRIEEEASSLKGSTARYVVVERVLRFVFLFH